MRPLPRIVWVVELVSTLFFEKNNQQMSLHTHSPSQIWLIISSHSVDDPVELWRGEEDWLASICHIIAHHIGIIQIIIVNYMIYVLISEDNFLYNMWHNCTHTRINKINIRKSHHSVNYNLYLNHDLLEYCIIWLFFFLAYN